MFQDRMFIVEVADEEVEFDKFVFHKLNLINRAANLPFLLLIRIIYPFEPKDRGRSKVPKRKSNRNFPDGFILRHTLKGHTDQINRFEWSPGGGVIASASHDRMVGIWNADTGELILMLKGHSKLIRSVTWSPDATALASASDDHTIRIWNPRTGELTHILEGHTSTVLSVAWSPSPEAQILASGSYDGSMRLWDIKTWRSLKVSTGWVAALEWSPDGQMLAVGNFNNNILLWAVEQKSFVREFPGHSEAIYSVAWSPDGQLLASGSGDKTVRIWDVNDGKQTNVLEGHTGTVAKISFSSDGRFLASKSRDNTVRIWRCDTWENVVTINEEGHLFSGLAFNPKESVLATLSKGAKKIRIWDLDSAVLLESSERTSSVHYTNAKVVLIGDTGVGKTGLGLALTNQPFIPTESTHGRHVWTFDQQKADLPEGRVETRETLLWDLAGQPGYRLIHQLHLNEVSVALVVFDSRSETDPFAGVRHWERALRQARRLQGDAAMPMKKFLIAARCDRGGIAVSPARVETFVRDMGFDNYFETSAKEGWNISNLIEAIHRAINWDSMPKVSSTDLFQSIKRFLISEKEYGHLLSTVDDLYFAFLKSEDITEPSLELRAQFDTCVGRVESSGLIKSLSFGDLILLQPEMLDAYASSMINAAKEEPDGLGSIAEEDASLGRFRMPEDERLPNKEQERLLLIATIENMLRHEIALREQADDGPLLIFPSQFTREHPEFPDPQGKAVVFSFEGPVLSVYATLAVRLSHSRVFKKQGMWKNAATYSAIVNGTCGIFLREVKEGQGELTLFYDSEASEETQFQFEEYVLTHLQRRALPDSIHRRRIFACSSCSEVITDKQAARRLERGHKTIACPVCEAEISLSDREERVEKTPSSVVNRIDRAANAQRELDAGLVSAAGEMRTRGFKKWAGASSATIAIVFTDIVGSTNLNVELGNEAMSNLRRIHFAQARRQLSNYKGYEIKTIGDSFMIAFRTAIDAIDFALSLFQRTGSDRIKIKVGIHVGPVHIEEEDAFGTMVNYASRVIGMAKGPEIWVSNAAKFDIDQEKARRHSNLNWIIHPDCELKGFSEKHILWSVIPDSNL